MAERETLEEISRLRKLLAEKEATVLRQESEIRILKSKVESLNRDVGILEAGLKHSMRGMTSSAGHGPPITDSGREPQSTSEGEGESN